MKLSVLIPMYNAEKYIGNCLDSLVNQDLAKEDYEILVMDDGSTDASSEVVNKYVKKYQNIFLFKESNVGESSTRNKLISKAKGDYIYNLDADDYILNNSLRSILDNTIQNNLEIFGFKTLLVDSIENLENRDFEINNKNIITVSGLDFIRDYRDMRHEVWWYIINTSFLRSTGIKFGENEFNADLVFTMSLFLSAKKIGFINNFIHRYVQTPDSVVRSPDINKRKIYIENLFSMMVSFSKLINSINPEFYDNEGLLIDNLKYRLDKGVFFNTIKMIRTGYSLKEVKEKIVMLKEVKAYPIKHFIGKEYNSVLFKLLNGLFNNENTLYCLVGIYAFLGLKQK